MATVVLGLIGGAAFSAYFGTGATIAGIAAASIGSAIGAVAGGLLDTYVIYPAIFKTDRDLRGPRLDDLRLQTASEGSDMKWCIGPTNRMAGTIIWLTDLIETQHSEDVGKGGGGESQKSYSYAVSVAIGVCEGPISRIVKIWADSKLVYDGGLIDSRYTSVTVYVGDHTQQPDTLIEAAEGAGEVPAFRGLAYVVFEEFQLADFGNRLPQFTFLVEQDAAMGVDAAFEAILKKGSFRDEVFDVTPLAVMPDVFRGITSSGPQSTAKLLEALLVAYDVVTREENGVLRFFQRSQVSSITIDPRDLSAHEYGSDNNPRPFSVTDSPGRELPKAVTVTFIEPSSSYQQSAQQETLVNERNPVHTKIDIPLVLTAEEARAIAQRILWSAWAERTKGIASLSPYHLNISESDKLLVTLEGEQHGLIVSTSDLGWNLVNEIKGVLFEGQTHDGNFDSPGDGGNGGIDVVTTPLTAVTLYLMNLPPFADDQVGTPGFFIAACGSVAAEVWQGGVLYAGTSITTLTPMQTIPLEATMGTAITALGQGPTNVIDGSNTVDILLLNGTLETRTDDEVNEGKNWAMLGNEIIAFRNATLIAPNTYRLSTLYRGLRDTVDSFESGPSAHAVGEKFCLLQSGYTIFNTINMGNIGQLLYYRFVPKYGQPGDYPVQTFTPTAENVKNFRPINVLTSGNGSDGDVGISWVRQSRWIDRPFTTASGPLDEPTEIYHLEIYYTGEFPVRTVVVTGQSFYNYTLAQKKADGFPQGTFPTFTFRIWQVGNILGRGNRQPPE